MVLFYVVITIFAQHLNICSPKLGEWRRLSPPPGYASGNSDWWLCGFDPFVAITKPYTIHAGHKKTNMARLAKSVTDRKMLSLLVVRSFRFHHINLSKKAIFWWKL